MKLYVNGDSHSTGHDAVLPGPNPAHSYGKLLADKLEYEFVCDAVAGCSNDSIVARTKNYLENNTPDFLIIGWSTWEREEWRYQGKTYQVTSSGFDQLPKGLHARYKQFVIDSSIPENQWAMEDRNHDLIEEMHEYLKNKKIPHLFFNCFSYFFYRVRQNRTRKDWGNNYIDPYNQNMTYYFWLEEQGYKPSNPKYYHYGADAHEAWADFLLPKVQDIVYAK